MPDDSNQPDSVAGQLEAALVAWREAPTPQALNALMKLVSQHALACLRSQGVAVADAQDVAQETARKIQDRLENDDRPGSVAALVRVTAHNANEDRRRKARWLWYGHDFAAMGKPDPVAHLHAAPAADVAIFASQIRIIASRMPPALRDVFECTVVDGLATEQLATFRTHIAFGGRGDEATQAWRAAYARELARLHQVQHRIRNWLRDHVDDLAPAARAAAPNRGAR